MSNYPGMPMAVILVDIHASIKVAETIRTSDSVQYVIEEAYIEAIKSTQYHEYY